jgi:uncharacterized protein (TIGR02246 family)
MQRRMLGALGSLLILACLSSAQAMKSGGSADQALKDLETKWIAASLKSDSATVGEILADDWTGTTAEGKVQTRGEYLAMTKKSKLTRSVAGDMHVRMLDQDAAVITGTWSGAGTDQDGKKFDTMERWSDIFVKKDGKWKCVSSHSSTVKK